ncbi:hypothetical protein VTJ04DRAFT_9307 [Mycothermus thermophilus]|uniref:uncharacterized protein n=1 Tax=Humicola insolens TaxID=85995 RepID=UPI003743E6E7
MHFALPPRKTSQPPPYLRPAASRLPLGLRRSRARLVAITGLFLFAVLWLLARSRDSGSSGSKAGGGSSHTTLVAPRRRAAGKVGDPPVVIVTVMDEKKFSREYLAEVKENRVRYAERHGYKTLFPTPSDYPLSPSPPSWAVVPAVRDALTRFPNSGWIWYLDASALIMNPQIKLEKDIVAPARLDELMRRDVPVVPPNSVVKTLAHLRGEDADLVLTQDGDGLSTGSFLVRNGEWARFFTESWFAPLLRSYNFQKAEVHALEHIVQWHATILSRVALVEQRVLNAYNKGANGAQEYKDGDLVVRFPGCEGAACETETRAFVQAWKRAFAAADSSS